MSRGGSSNPDCQEFYKESKLYLRKLSGLSAELENLLKDLTELRSKQWIGPTKRTNLQNIDIVPTVKSVEDLSKEIPKMEEKFLKIAQNEKSCSATLFFRARYNMGLIEKKRLSILFLLSKFLTGQLTLYARHDIGKHRSELVNLLAMVDTYNQIIAADNCVPSIQHPAKNSQVLSVLHNNRHYHTHIHENFCSAINHQLRPITSSKMLGMVARERAKAAAMSLADTIVMDMDKQQLEFITSDVSWLVTPLPYTSVSQELHYAGSSASAKNKDGDGTKRKNKASPSAGDAGPKNDVFQPNMRTHFGAVERLIEDESVVLHQVLAAIPRVPGLVQPNMLKEGKGGDQKLNGAMRKKMGEYYHEILWRTVGQLCEEPVLWQGAKDRIPLGLVHPRVPLALADILKDYVGAQMGESYPSLVLPAVHIIVEMLNIHVIASSWDLQMVRCLAVSSRSKTSHVVLTDQSQSSLAGKHFNQTINSLVHLNNRCIPDVLRDIVDHGTHDPEEFPFLEEIHVLSRLQASLFAIRNWVESKSAATIQSWKVADFFLINHGDLLRLLPPFDLLQISPHNNVSQTNTTSIKLFTHVQSAVAKQVQSCQAKIKGLPGEQNDAMCRVCRTFCLATLQNIFPAKKNWNKSGSAPTTHNKYVQEYIERILAPVFLALDKFPTPTQQSVGRLAIKTVCDSWLEHIYQKKIKFSEHGARQLFADFSFLRSWVSSSSHMSEDSKRYLLLLDSIRQCEGVAQLLQNTRVQEVAVRPTKQNQVAPEAETCEEEESPVQHILENIPPELYVPDHQKWKSLRVGGGGSKMGLPFCC